MNSYYIPLLRTQAKDRSLTWHTGTPLSETRNHTPRRKPRVRSERNTLTLLVGLLGILWVWFQNQSLTRHWQAYILRLTNPLCLIHVTMILSKEASRCSHRTHHRKPRLVKIQRTEEMLSLNRCVYNTTSAPRLREHMKKEVERFWEPREQETCYGVESLVEMTRKIQTQYCSNMVDKQDSNNDPLINTLTRPQS